MTQHSDKKKPPPPKEKEKEKPPNLTRGHRDFNPLQRCKRPDADCAFLRAGTCSYRHDCDDAPKKNKKKSATSATTATTGGGASSSDRKPSASPNLQPTSSSSPPPASAPARGRSTATPQQQQQQPPIAYVPKKPASTPFSDINRLVVFHDGENCCVPKGPINAIKLKELVINSALSCMDDASALKRNQLRHNTTYYFFIRRRAGCPHQPSNATYEDLKACCSVVDSPSKPGSVDHKMIGEMRRLADISKGADGDKDTAVVVLTADSDYAGAIGDVASAGLPVILIHGGNVKRSGGVEVPCDVVFDCWEQLVADATDAHGAPPPPPPTKEEEADAPVGSIFAPPLPMVPIAVAVAVAEAQTASLTITDSGGSKRIEVVEAQWGLIGEEEEDKDKEKEDDQVVDVTPIIRENALAHEGRRLDLNAEIDLLGDPSHGDKKTLRVVYRLLPDGAQQEMYVKEHQLLYIDVDALPWTQMSNLPASSGELEETAKPAEILKAEYGVFHGVFFLNDRTVDVTGQVRQMVSRAGGKPLSFRVSPAVFGDPADGILKELRLTIKRGWKEEQLVADDMQVVTIPNAPVKRHTEPTIQVVRALYGYWSLFGEKKKDVTAEVADLLAQSDGSSLSFKVTNALFGDPAHGKKKELRLTLGRPGGKFEHVVVKEDHMVQVEG